MDQQPVPADAERWQCYLRVLEARSADTSPGRLSVLAADEIRPIRLWTARNPNTPPEALRRLAHDEDSTVRWQTLFNPATPPHALEAMAQHEAAEAHPDTFAVRHLVLHHPNTDPALREQLARVGACSNRTWYSSLPCPGFRPYRRQMPT
ncbi:hypothetical protein ACPPVO_24120 [Dactylosporangium sp. McL0621]|uniref:hypothetical protein n=1 Tax=Dactylosporangium sp. McL0621 TaxID=3415678 RepID=UPI003CF6D6DB